MTEDRKRVEFIEEKHEPRDGRRGSIRDVLDGSVLSSDLIVKQLPFIIFLTVLALVYIANRYHAEKLFRKITIKQESVRELRSEAISSSSELMFISKQSEVIKMVQEQGLELEEAIKPPRKILLIKR